jgi:hypothetical protein
LPIRQKTPPLKSSASPIQTALQVSASRRRHLVGLPVEDAEVERQHSDDEGEEGDPGNKVGQHRFPIRAVEDRRRALSAGSSPGRVR